jgi:hypothetical protein
MDDNKKREYYRIYQWKRYWLDKEYKQKAIKHALKYYYEHREEILKKRDENKVRKARNSRNYYRRNKEKCLLANKLWKKNHPDYMKNYLKEYNAIKV